MDLIQPGTAGFSSSQVAQQKMNNRKVKEKKIFLCTPNKRCMPEIFKSLSCLKLSPKSQSGARFQKGTPVMVEFQHQGPGTPSSPWNQKVSFIDRDKRDVRLPFTAALNFGHSNDRNVTHLSLRSAPVSRLLNQTSINYWQNARHVFHYGHYNGFYNSSTWPPSCVLDVISKDFQLRAFSTIWQERQLWAPGAVMMTGLRLQSPKEPMKFWAA